MRPRVELRVFIQTSTSCSACPRLFIQLAKRINQYTRNAINASGSEDHRARWPRGPSSHTELYHAAVREGVLEEPAATQQQDAGHAGLRTPSPVKASVRCPRVRQTVRESTAGVLYLFSSVHLLASREFFQRSSHSAADRRQKVKVPLWSGSLELTGPGWFQQHSRRHLSNVLVPEGHPQVVIFVQHDLFHPCLPHPAGLKSEREAPEAAERDRNGTTVERADSRTWVVKHLHHIHLFKG